MGTRRLAWRRSRVRRRSNTAVGSVTCSLAPVIADLGLARSILSSFADVDLQGASPISTLWRRITARLTPREAELLPHTLGEVIPLLTGSPARLRLALDLVATFDLVETLPTLLRLASQLATADLVET